METNNGNQKLASADVLYVQMATAGLKDFIGGYYKGSSGKIKSISPGNQASNLQNGVHPRTVERSSAAGLPLGSASMSKEYEDMKKPCGIAHSWQQKPAQAHESRNHSMNDGHPHPAKIVQDLVESQKHSNQNLCKGEKAKPCKQAQVLCENSGGQNKKLPSKEDTAARAVKCIETKGWIPPHLRGLVETSSIQESDRISNSSFDSTKAIQGKKRTFTETLKSEPLSQSSVSVHTEKAVTEKNTNSVSGKSGRANGYLSSSSKSCILASSDGRPKESNRFGSSVDSTISSGCIDQDHSSNAVKRARLSNELATPFSTPEVSRETKVCTSDRVSNPRESHSKETDEVQVSPKRTPYQESKPSKAMSAVGQTLAQHYKHEEKSNLSVAKYVVPDFGAVKKPIEHTQLHKALLTKSLETNSKQVKESVNAAEKYGSSWIPPHMRFLSQNLDNNKQADKAPTESESHDDGKEKPSSEIPYKIPQNARKARLEPSQALPSESSRAATGVKYAPNQEATIKVAIEQTTASTLSVCSKSIVASQELNVFGLSPHRETQTSPVKDAQTTPLVGNNDSTHFIKASKEESASPTELENEAMGHRYRKRHHNKRLDKAKLKNNAATAAEPNEEKTKPNGPVKPRSNPDTGTNIHQQQPDLGNPDDDVKQKLAKHSEKTRKDSGDSPKSLVKHVDERGPMPNKFCDQPIVDKDLQRRMNSGHNLPTLSEQLEQLLPAALRNIPPPKFEGARLRAEKARRETERENRLSEVHGKQQNKKVKETGTNSHRLSRMDTPTTPSKPKQQKSESEWVTRPLQQNESGTLSSVRKNVVNETGKRDAGNGGAERKESPLRRQWVPITMENTLENVTSDRLRKISESQANKSDRISSDSSLAVQKIGSHVAQVQTESTYPPSKQERFDPFSHDQMAQYNIRAVDYLKQDNPDIEVDIEQYFREEHRGAPDQAPDNDSHCATSIYEEDIERTKANPSTNDIYAWRWFSKRKESLCTASDSEQAASELKPEVCKWDSDFEVPSQYTIEKDSYDIGRDKVTTIEHWLDGILFSAVQRPFSVDTTTDLFKSGRQMVSGMRREYAQYPPWCLATFNKPNFGPIDWMKIPTIPPTDDYSNHPIRRKQTSAICSRIATKQHRRNVKEERRVLKQKEQESRTTFEKVKKTLQEQYRNPLTQNPDNNPWVPSANFFIRPANFEDMGEVADLYKYYTNNTIHTMELSTTVDRAFFESLFRRCEEEYGPFLVAVLRGRQKTKGITHGKTDDLNWFYRNGKPRRRRRPDPAEFSKIIGFSYVLNVGDRHTCMKDMGEVFMYVHPDFLRQGVGKNLFDRVMPGIDKLYETHCGVDMVCPEMEARFLMNGGRRPKKKITFTLYYQSKDNAEFKWKKAWLERQGFHAVAFFLNGAEKDCGPVNVVIMMREAMSGPSNRSYIYPGEPANVPNLIRGI